MTPDEFRSVLAAFSHIESYYAHESGLHYTDGVAFLAKHAGAYWLIDLIGSYQKRCRKDRQLREFQIWQLWKKGNQADLVCLRDLNDEAFRHRRTLMFTYKRYKRTKFWSVWDGETLVAVVVYKKGAKEVSDRLNQLRRNHDSAHP
jgi:hypothetical protein